MAPKIIASATAAASWVNRRKASSRNNRSGKKGNDGSDRAASPFSKMIGDTAKTSVSSSEKSGSSDQDDYDGHYLGEKASKMDVKKSRRRPRSTVQKVDHTDDHGPSRIASDGLNKRQQDRRIKQKSKKSLAKTCVMTPPRHQQVSTNNNDRRSKRRSRSESDANKCNKTPPSLSKQKLRNRQHPPQENNSPPSGHKLSRYIEQRSNNINNSHCNSKDDDRGGREKQIASSATATTTNNTDDEVSSSTTPNKYYQPYRCRNIQSDQDNNITETKDAAVVNGRRNYHSQYNERSRSKSMPQQSTYHRPGTSPLIRKQAYFNTDNTATTEGDGARAQSKKKQLSSFEQQLLQQGPLPLPQSSFDEQPRKQLSFEEQLRRQKPLPTRPLSFEQQLLHQKPLPGTNTTLSFEQQLLQQEPPPPFGLPRALSESLGVSPSTSDDIPLVSFEQQLRQQPELINYYNNFGGLPTSSPQHQHVQSSFADATANSDGSSVIYFRNDSGRVILGSQRSTSLPPSLGGDGGGSMEDSVYEESDYDEDDYEDDYDSSTDWSDIERQSQAMSKSRGGVSSPASSSSSSPQGVDGVTTFRHGNVDNGRSTAVPPLARKTTYNTAMEVAPPHSLQTQSNLTQMNHPPSLSLLPNQYPLPHQPPPPQLNGDTITPEEYQRLQLESELVRARMLEIEERIRAIESKRGITHGGGVVDSGLRDVGSGQEGSIVWSSSGSEGESDDSYYSDSEEEEEEEDEDTIGDLLSSVSLLNQSKRRHRSYGDRDEDENTITPFLSSTSLTMRPLEEEENNENEESEEANIEIHKNMVSVSSLYCEGNSSYVSIATKDEDDSSAAETDHNDSEQGSEERSTDTAASKRRVRFEDEDQYQSASHHTSVQPPPTEMNTTDNPMSRHQKPLERKSTHSSTSSASTNMSSLLEHAPLEEHLKGIKQRRSKLLELVEAQDQNRNDSKTKRSIEFSLFLMKDKLNQLQALGVLGEDGEEDLLKSGDAHRLLGEIRSDGGTNESE